MPEEEVHDGRGVDMTEKQRHEARLGLDVVDHLEAGELVRIPVLPGNKEKNNSQEQTQKTKENIQRRKVDMLLCFYNESFMKDISGITKDSLEKEVTNRVCNKKIWRN